MLDRLNRRLLEIDADLDLGLGPLLIGDLDLELALEDDCLRRLMLPPRGGDRDLDLLLGRDPERDLRFMPLYGRRKCGGDLLLFAAANRPGGLLLLSFMGRTSFVFTSCPSIQPPSMCLTAFSASDAFSNSMYA